MKGISTARIRSIAGNFYLVLIMIFLYAPIFTLVVLSFNSSKSRARWGGFTLDWYQDLFTSAQILSAFRNTLLIAFLSALIATEIGTVAGIGIHCQGSEQYSHAQCGYCHGNILDAGFFGLWHQPGISHHFDQPYNL